MCLFFFRRDEKEYALKQIEGTGISMSACREIAVSSANLFKHCFKEWFPKHVKYSTNDRHSVQSYIFQLWLHVFLGVFKNNLHYVLRFAGFWLILHMLLGTCLNDLLISKVCCQFTWLIRNNPGRLHLIKQHCLILEGLHEVLSNIILPSQSHNCFLHKSHDSGLFVITSLMEGKHCADIVVFPCNKMRHVMSCCVCRCFMCKIIFHNPV